jgi:hypothetical protein
MKQSLATVPVRDAEHGTIHEVTAADGDSRVIFHFPERDTATCLRGPARHFEANGTQPTSVMSTQATTGRGQAAEAAEAAALPFTYVPISSLRLATFESLQNWEGTVLSVDGKDFAARLIDQSQNSPNEEGIFSIAEVTPEDRVLIQPGAVFYWSIGYHDSVSGQRTRASIIRFRRMPIWSRNDISRAEREAEQFVRSIKWE